MNYIKLLELICLCVGLLTYTKIQSLPIRIVIWVVVLTVFNELLVINLVKEHAPAYRNFAYSVFSVFERTGWLIVFYKIHATHRVQKLIVPVSIALFVTLVYEFVQPGNWLKFNIVSYSFYGVVIIIFSFLYLRRLLRKEDYQPIFRNSLFWLCAAGILFHGIFIINIVTLQDTAYWKAVNSTTVFYFLLNLANTFYYGCLCICFLTSAYFKSQ